MKFKLLMFATAMLLLVSFAGAQNYSGTRFSATFNGPVTTNSFTNPTNSNVSYQSHLGNVWEYVTVRTTYNDIPVNFDGTRFYRDHLGDNVVGGVTFDTSVNRDDFYQGHPYSYGCYTYTYDGVQYIDFTRAIIVDSRTAIFISMTMPVNEDTDKTTNNANIRWQDFEYTLNIQ